MKNDALLKSFAQKGLKAQLHEANHASKLQGISPLDSGELIHVKGGHNTNCYCDECTVIFAN